MQLNLNNHTGMIKPVAPAFGIPLMKFSEDPDEAFYNGTIQITNQNELEAMKKYVDKYQ